MSRVDQLKAAEGSSTDDASSLSSVPSLVDMIQHGECEDQRRALLLLRELLSNHAAGIAPSISPQTALDAGVLPTIVKLLSGDDASGGELAYDAVAIVSQLAPHAVEQRVGLDGILTQLIPILTSKREDIRAEAALAVGHMVTGEGSRDTALQHGVAQRIAEAVAMPSQEVTTTRHLAWLVSALSRASPLSEPRHVAALVPTMVRLLHHEDADVHTDACWSIVYLTDGSADNVGLVAGQATMNRLIDLVALSSVSTQTPALRCFRHFVTYGPNDAACLAGDTVVPQLRSLLQHRRRVVKLESLQCLAAICNRGRVQIVTDGALFPDVLQLLRSDEVETRRDAAACVWAAVSHGSPAHIAHLIRLGAIGALCEALPYIPECLRPLDHLLKSGADDGRSAVVNLIVASEGKESIRSLLIDPQWGALASDALALLEGRGTPTTPSADAAEQ